MRFTFEVLGKPVPQGSMRALGAGRMVHANNQALMPWRAAVTATAAAAMPLQWDQFGPMWVEATFLLPRPKGHHGANGLKRSAPWWPTTKPDLDKLARALMDALTAAGAWADDSQVVQLDASKQYHDNGNGLLVCAVEHLTERHP